MLLLVKFKRNMLNVNFQTYNCCQNFFIILFCFQESDNITAPLRLVEIFSDLSHMKADVSVTLFRVLVSSIEPFYNGEFV